MSVLFYLCFLFSCNHKPEFVPLSQFQIDNSKIQNLDKVSLIYSSETPLQEEKLSYFIQMVGINMRTNDTLNILTTFNRGGGKGDFKNEFKFYTLDSEEAKDYFNKLYNDKGENYSFETVSKIDRVVHDKRFSFIANNHYPTVIGFLEK
ncbi:MAG: hypothetical protein LRY27_04810 [Chitinophagales bacterium]|nr:hypothetical protein [Chitinophagales bacterium]